MNSNIIVSIIIPCYNDGKLLLENLEVLLKIYNPEIHEVHIVNDGSTDNETLEFLKTLIAKNLFVWNKENGGLSSARNFGIKKARGKYILPLDSDNILTNSYLEKGVQILEENSDISIVFGLSECFGNKTGLLNNENWNLQTILSYNYIDACTLIRKSSIEEIGEYDEKMKKGLEDWDLWIRFSISNYKFYFLNEIVQKYRVRKNSMVNTSTKNNRSQIIDYLNEKHNRYINTDSIDKYYFEKFNSAPFLWTTKLVIKKKFPRLYRKLITLKYLNKYL